jgi:hypothetical protein
MMQVAVQTAPWGNKSVMAKRPVPRLKPNPRLSHLVYEGSHSQ